MKRSESISKLAVALSKFQGEVKNPPNSANNPFFKSKYAPLDVVINTAKPALAKHGLSFIQFPSCDGETVSCTTMLMFEDEFIESEPISFKPLKVDIQSMGAAITYIKRYQLSAMLGLASEEDKDGENLKDKNNGKKSEEDKAREEMERAAKEKIDEIKIKTIRNLLSETHTDETQFCNHYSIGNLQLMTNATFMKAMQALEKKKEHMPKQPTATLDI